MFTVVLQLWDGYVSVFLVNKGNRSAIISACLETVTTCILFVSLVYTFNRPALMKALDRTTDVINLQLTYEKVNSDARMANACLIALFVFHLIHDFWFFCSINKIYFVDKVLYIYNISVDKAGAATIYFYIMTRSPTFMTCIFRMLIAKMFFELGSRFKILLCRLQLIRYKLEDVSKRNSRIQQSLFLVTRVLDAHAVVRGAVRDVMDILQLPLLTMTMHLMAKILISTFFFIKHCRRITGTIMIISYVRLGLLLAVNVIHILWFIAICEPCNRIIDMDRELCSLVARCLRRLSPEEGSTTAHSLNSLRRTVEERAACALHFNVMDICELDRLMLVKILGVVSTYLILLIQY